MKEPKRSRVIAEALGGSALSLAVQTRRLARDLQPWWPENLDAWREHVQTTASEASSTWLPAIEPALSPSGPAAQRLRRVASERGIVVTTGQQAGLFGGPLYTLAKALTAIRLADLIEELCGVPAAPVFWGATDDADFLEACVAHVADADGLHELRLETRPPAGTPMSLTPLGDTKPLLEQLRRACGSAAHAEFFDVARDAFGTEPTLGGAYIRLLRGLLEPLGMAVLDSSHPAYRAASRPVLTEALKNAADVARAASESAQRIRAAGFEPQVEDDRGLSLVFAIENGVKRRIGLDESRKSASVSSDLAPNVLLRPLIERSLLPTVAYVAGPGELAYFAQSNAVARALDLHPAVGVPRVSCTIVEPFAGRALERLDVKHHELQDLHALQRRLAAAAMPAGVASAWKRLEDEMTASIRALGQAVRVEDLMPPPVIEGLERALAHRLSRAERRLLAAVKRRDERIRKDLEVASAALYPMGKRQERVLNFIPMLARGGDELMSDMLRAGAEHARSLMGAGRAEPAIRR